MTRAISLAMVATLLLASPSLAMIAAPVQAAPAANPAGVASAYAVPVATRLVDSARASFAFHDADADGAFDGATDAVYLCACADAVLPGDIRITLATPGSVVPRGAADVGRPLARLPHVLAFLDGTSGPQGAWSADDTAYLAQNIFRVEEGDIRLTPAHGRPAGSVVRGGWMAHPELLAYDGPEMTAEGLAAWRNPQGEPVIDYELVPNLAAVLAAGGDDLTFDDLVSRVDLRVNGTAFDPTRPPVALDQDPDGDYRLANLRPLAAPVRALGSPTAGGDKAGLLVLDADASGTATPVDVRLFDPGFGSVLDLGTRATAPLRPSPLGSFAFRDADGDRALDAGEALYLVRPGSVAVHVNSLRLASPVGGSPGSQVLGRDADVGTTLRLLDWAFLAGPSGAYAGHPDATRVKPGMLRAAPFGAASLTAPAFRLVAAGDADVGQPIGRAPATSLSFLDLDGRGTHGSGDVDFLDLDADRRVSVADVQLGGALGPDPLATLYAGTLWESPTLDHLPAAERAAAEADVARFVSLWGRILADESQLLLRGFLEMDRARVLDPAVPDIDVLAAPPRDLAEGIESITFRVETSDGLLPFAAATLAQTTSADLAIALDAPTFCVRVVAIVNGLDGAASPTRCGPAPSSPLAPTNVRVREMQAGNRLQWQPPASLPLLAGYDVLRHDAATGAWTHVASTVIQHYDPVLAPGELGCYRVQPRATALLGALGPVTCLRGFDADAAPAPVVAPIAQGLVLNADPLREVRDQPVTGYRVEVGLPEGAPVPWRADPTTWTPLATLAPRGADRVVYYDTLAVDGAERCYRIVALTAAGESSPSAPVCAIAPVAGDAPSLDKLQLLPSGLARASWRSPTDLVASHVAAAEAGVRASAGGVPVRLPGAALDAHGMPLNARELLFGIERDARVPSLTRADWALLLRFVEDEGASPSTVQLYERAYAIRALAGRGLDAATLARTDPVQAREQMLLYTYLLEGVAIHQRLPLANGAPATKTQADAGAADPAPQPLGAADVAAAIQDKLDASRDRAVEALRRVPTTTKLDAPQLLEPRDRPFEGAIPLRLIDPANLSEDDAASLADHERVLASTTERAFGRFALPRARGDDATVALLATLRTPAPQRVAFAQALPVISPVGSAVGLQPAATTLGSALDVLGRPGASVADTLGLGDIVRVEAVVDDARIVPGGGAPVSLTPATLNEMRFDELLVRRAPSPTDVALPQSSPVALSHAGAGAPALSPARAPHLERGFNVTLAPLPAPALHETYDRAGVPNDTLDLRVAHQLALLRYLVDSAEDPARVVGHEPTDASSSSAALVGWATELRNRADASVPVVPRPTQESAGHLLSTLVESSHWTACGELAGDERVCAERRVPYGVPITLDLDANESTGVAGKEVLVRLTPVPSRARVDGFTATLEVTTLVQTALPARIDATWTVGYAEHQVVAGFDARASSLAPHQSATVALADAPAALAGFVNLSSAVTRDAQPGAGSYFAGVLPADPRLPLAVDPTFATLSLAKMPANFTLDLALAPTLLGESLVASVAAAAPVEATLEIAMTRGASERVLTWTLPALPSSLRMAVDIDAETGELAWSYAAPKRLASLDHAHRFAPDAEGVEAVRALVRLEDAPASLTFTTRHPFTTRIDTGLPKNSSAPLGLVLVVLSEEDERGVITLLREDASRLTGVWSMSASVFPPRLESRTSGDLPEFEVEALHRDSRDIYGRAYARLVGSPAVVSLGITGEGLATVDTRTSPASDARTGTVNSLLYRYATDSAFLPVVAWPHAFYQRGADTRASLHARGLQYLSVELADQRAEVDLERVETSSRFQFDLADVDAALAGDLTSPPRDFELSVDQHEVHYDSETGNTSALELVYGTRQGTITQLDVQRIGESAMNLAIDLPALAFSSARAIASLHLDTQSDGGAWRFGIDADDGIPLRWGLEVRPGERLALRGEEAPFGDLRAFYTDHGATIAFAGDHVVHRDDLAGAGTDGSLAVRGLRNLTLRPDENERSFLDARFQDAKLGKSETLRVATRYLDAESRTVNLDALSDVRGAPDTGLVWDLGRNSVVATNATMSLLATFDNGAAGAVAAAPTPPLHHGLSARDGLAADNRTGARLALYVTGLADRLEADVDAPRFHASEWTPAANATASGIPRWTLDLELDERAPSQLGLENIDWLVDIVDIPADVGMTLTANPSESAAERAWTLVLDTRLQPGTRIGRIVALMREGQDEAFLDVVAIRGDLAPVFRSNARRFALEWRTEDRSDRMKMRWTLLDTAGQEGIVAVDMPHGDWDVILEPAGPLRVHGKNDTLHRVVATLTSHGELLSVAEGEHVLLRRDDVSYAYDAALELRGIQTLDLDPRAPEGVMLGADLRERSLGKSTDVTFVTRYHDEGLRHTNLDAQVTLLGAGHTSLDATFGRALDIDPVGVLDVVHRLDIGTSAALHAAPEPALGHGLFLTDALVAGHVARKETMHLTGLRGNLTFDPDVPHFDVRDWTPSATVTRTPAAEWTLDSNLRDRPTTAVHWFMALNGIPAATDLGLGGNPTRDTLGQRAFHVDLHKSPAPIAAVVLDLFEDHDELYVAMDPLDKSLVADATLDGTAYSFDYAALGRADRLAASYRLHDTDSLHGFLELTDAHERWTVRLDPEGTIEIDGGAEPFRTIFGALTDHETFLTTPGDHLVFRRFDGLGSREASFRFSGLQRLVLNPEPSTGVTLDLDLRDDSGLRTTTFDWVSHFQSEEGWWQNLTGVARLVGPSRTHLAASLGRTHALDPTGTLDLAYTLDQGAPGALAATPTPPARHGLAARDGRATDGEALRQAFFLTGLEGRFALDPDAPRLEFMDWTPSAERAGTPLAEWTYDQQLDERSPEPMDLYARWQGIPANYDVVVTGNPVDAAASRTFRIDVDHTVAEEGKLVRAFEAAFREGDDRGSVRAATVRGDLSPRFTFEGPDVLVDWTAEREFGLVELGYALHETSNDAEGVIRLYGAHTSWTARATTDGLLVLDPEGEMFELVEGHLTNHGSILTQPGDHLIFRRNETSGEVDGSFRLRGVRSLVLDPATLQGVRLDIDLGDALFPQLSVADLALLAIEPDSFGLASSRLGAIVPRTDDFDLYSLHDEADGVRTLLDASLVLRGAGDATFEGVWGRRVVLQPSVTLDLVFDAQRGRPDILATLEDTPLRHGFAMRDAAAVDGDAYRTRSYTTGILGALDIDPDAPAIDLHGWTPLPSATGTSDAQWTYDVSLDDRAGVDLAWFAHLTGIAASTDIRMTGNPRPQGNERIYELRVEKPAANLGGLTLDAVEGDDVAHLAATQLRGSADVRMLLSPALRDFGWSSSARTGTLTLAYRLLDSDGIHGYTRLVDAHRAWNVSLEPRGVLRLEPGVEPFHVVEGAWTDHESYLTTPSRDHAFVRRDDANLATEASYRFRGLDSLVLDPAAPQGLALELATLDDLGVRTKDFDLVSHHLSTGAMWRNLTGAATLDGTGGATLDLAIDRDIAIDVGGSLDLAFDYAHGSAGALAATPMPPARHGMAVRDGPAGAERIRFYTTGMEDTLVTKVDAPRVDIVKWAPKASATGGSAAWTYDGILDDQASLLETTFAMDGIPRIDNLSFRGNPERLLLGAWRWAPVVEIDLPVAGSSIGKMDARFVDGDQTVVLGGLALQGTITPTLTTDSAGFAALWRSEKPTGSGYLGQSELGESQLQSFVRGAGDLTAWNVTLGEAGTLVLDPSGRFTLVEGAMTDHGTLVNASGDHVHLFTDRSTGSLESSFRLRGVSGMSVVADATSGVTLDLHMTAGSRTDLFALRTGHVSALGPVKTVEGAMRVQGTGASDIRHDIDRVITGKVVGARVDHLFRYEQGDAARLAGMTMPPAAHAYQFQESVDPTTFRAMLFNTGVAGDIRIDPDTPRLQISDWHTTQAWTFEPDRLNSVFRPTLWSATFAGVAPGTSVDLRYEPTLDGIDRTLRPVLAVGPDAAQRVGQFTAGFQEGDDTMSLVAHTVGGTLAPVARVGAWGFEVDWSSGNAHGVAEARWHLEDIVRHDAQLALRDTDNDWSIRLNKGADLVVSPTGTFGSASLSFTDHGVALDASGPMLIHRISPSGEDGALRYDGLQGLRVQPRVGSGAQIDMTIAPVHSKDWGRFLSLHEGADGTATRVDGTFRTPIDGAATFSSHFRRAPTVAGSGSGVELNVRQEFGTGAELAQVADPGALVPGWNHREQTIGGRTAYKTNLWTPTVSTLLELNPDSLQLNAVDIQASSISLDARTAGGAILAQIQGVPRGTDIRFGDTTPSTSNDMLGPYTRFAPTIAIGVEPGKVVEEVTVDFTSAGFQGRIFGGPLAGSLQPAVILRADRMDMTWTTTAPAAVAAVQFAPTSPAGLRGAMTLADAPAAWSARVTTNPSLVIESANGGVFGRLEGSFSVDATATEIPVDNLYVRTNDDGMQDASFAISNATHLKVIAPSAAQEHFSIEYGLAAGEHSPAVALHLEHDGAHPEMVLGTMGHAGEGAMRIEMGGGPGGYRIQDHTASPEDAPMSLDLLVGQGPASRTLPEPEMTTGISLESASDGWLARIQLGGVGGHVQFSPAAGTFDVGHWTTSSEASVQEVRLEFARAMCNEAWRCAEMGFQGALAMWRDYTAEGGTVNDFGECIVMGTQGIYDPAYMRDHYFEVANDIARVVCTTEKHVMALPSFGFYSDAVEGDFVSSVVDPSPASEAAGGGKVPITWTIHHLEVVNGNVVERTSTVEGVPTDADRLSAASLFSEMLEQPTVRHWDPKSFARLVGIDDWLIDYVDADLDHVKEAVAAAGVGEDGEPITRAVDIGITLLTLQRSDITRRCFEEEDLQACAEGGALDDRILVAMLNANVYGGDPLTSFDAVFTRGGHGGYVRAEHLSGPVYHRIAASIIGIDASAQGGGGWTRVLSSFGEADCVRDEECLGGQLDAVYVDMEGVGSTRFNTAGMMVEGLPSYASEWTAGNSTLTSLIGWSFLSDLLQITWTYEAIDMAGQGYSRLSPLGAAFSNGGVMPRYYLGVDIALGTEWEDSFEIPRSELLDMLRVNVDLWAGAKLTTGANLMWLEARVAKISPDWAGSFRPAFIGRGDFESFDLNFKPIHIKAGVEGSITAAVFAPPFLGGVHLFDVSIANAELLLEFALPLPIPLVVYKFGYRGKLAEYADDWDVIRGEVGLRARPQAERMFEVPEAPASSDEKFDFTTMPGGRLVMHGPLAAAVPDLPIIMDLFGVDGSDYVAPAMDVLGVVVEWKISGESSPYVKGYAHIEFLCADTVGDFVDDLFGGEIPDIEFCEEDLGDVENYGCGLGEDRMDEIPWPDFENWVDENGNGFPDLEELDVIMIPCVDDLTEDQEYAARYLPIALGGL